MTPSSLSGKEEKWREWIEEVRGFIEASKAGMKSLLMRIEKAQEQGGPVNKDWVTNNEPLLAGESDISWRSLEALTEEATTQEGRHIG